LQDKAAQRTKVIFELGILLSPVYDLIKRTPPPSSTDYRIAGVTFRRDVTKFYHGELGRFTRFSTIEFYTEGYGISQKLYGIANLLNSLANNKTDDERRKQSILSESTETTKSQILEIIDQIPIDWQAVLFQEAIPFSTYLRIYDVIRTLINEFITLIATLMQIFTHSIYATLTDH
jgi:hypothetical protein